MLYPKSPRHRDSGFLERIRGMGCIVCGIRPVDAHHLKSRAAGGPDTASNVVPICRKHHTESHTIGQRSFSKKYALGWFDD